MPLTESPVETLKPTRRTMARISSGTFPVSRGYRLRQMLYNPWSIPRYPNNASWTGGIELDGLDETGLVGSDETPDVIIPPMPFDDAPVYADTIDLSAVALHQVWGGLLTPENIAAQVHTNDIRYHAWVAAMKVVEQDRQSRKERTPRERPLLDATMDQFFVELSLALLDLCPGPVIVFVDPRLHDNAAAMVDRARHLVALFDKANVRRWRVVVTLPATEDGIRAAAVLTEEYSIQTNLSLVSCLPHAAACIEAGAKMVTMSVGGILEWYEQQQKPVPKLTVDHPGIEMIQTCVSYILLNKLNATLMTADIRNWTELKQLSGIGGAALTEKQLDQIPMRTLTTWFPRSNDTSRSTINARAAPYPTRYLESKPGFLMSLLPANCRSLVSAVLYVRLGQMKVWMEEIEAVVKDELKHRIKLAKMDVIGMYRCKSWVRRRASKDADGKKSSMGGLSRRSSSSSLASNASVSDSDHLEKPRSSSDCKGTATPLVEGVDYF